MVERDTPRRTAVSSMDRNALAAHESFCVIAPSPHGWLLPSDRSSVGMLGYRSPIFRWESAVGVVATALAVSRVLLAAHRRQGPG